MYENEPFIQNVIKLYPDEFDANSIIEYYNNKISLRTGKPITNGSKVNQISVLKKNLKQIKNIPELVHLRVDKSIENDVKTNQIKQLEKKHMNQLVIPTASQFIKNTLEGLHSKRIEDLYPALLLASGRRPTELYLMKSFRKGNKDNEIIFKDQLKKRNDETMKYTIQLLVDVKTFRKALKNFHKLVDVDSLSSEEIYKKYSKQNADIMLYFSAMNEIKLKASDMRRIYVAELYRRTDKKISFNYFVMKFLGHSDMNSSLNYTTVLLQD